MTAHHESFGEMLARKRNAAGLVQREVANPGLGLSYSFIAMLESGKRGKKQVVLSRAQVWYLVTRLQLWPPECDEFLRAAGHAVDRSSKEEQDIQRHYSFRELWVFARTILDPDDEWYQIVKSNILNKNVTYRYFTETSTTFLNLYERLKRDRVREADLKSHLECTLLPRQLFIMNFAIYKQDDHKIYCCGSKPAHGKGEAFFTMHSSEADRLYEQLHDWRGIINLEHTIPLDPARRVFPKPDRVSEFSTSRL